LRAVRPLLLLLPLVLAALVYAPLFDGFWLGDDGANLHRTYALAQQHRLWSQTAQFFVSAVPSGGAFYRPLVMATYALNFVITDAHYAGWLAMNLAVHIANVGLVVAVVLRLGKRLGCDARAAAIVAALVFGLAPIPAEAVYWISARSDGWIVLISLLAVYVWASDRSAASTVFALPALLVLALGFKESAAVLPLQMALVAWAWPSPRRSQLVAIAATFAIVAAWFFLRAHLFGSLWHVYAPPGGDENATLWTLDQGLRSIPAWWNAQAAPHAGIAALYAIVLGTAVLAAFACARGPRARLAAALVAASAGLLLATLLNIGLHASGEGGRNFYAPFAWLALALGVALARPQRETGEPARRVALSALMAAALLGAITLDLKIDTVLAAQQHVRAFAAALDTWATSHPGLTMIIVPEMDGPVVTLRNAQAALALPPIQQRPLLHRTLPTLPREIAMRYEQFSRGLATRLETMAPGYIDTSVLAALAQSDTVRWPPIACWSAAQQRLVALPQSDPADARGWSEAVLASARACLTPDAAGAR